MPSKQAVARSSRVARSKIYKTKAPEHKPFSPNRESKVKIELSQKSQILEPSKNQSWTHVGHVQAGFLTVAQASERLGVSIKTVSRWCKSGKLPAITKTYGKKTSFIVSEKGVDALLSQTTVKLSKPEKQKTPIKEHKDFIELWKRAMASGLMTGKAFSSQTVWDYSHYVDLYFKRHREVSITGLKTELMKIAAHQISKRQHCYKAIVCFAKFLTREKSLDEAFLLESKPLSPKRHLPPKRITVSEDDLSKVLEACESHQDRLVVILLASTGIRATEACSLKWEDIDLEKGTLTVKLAKGGKTRTLGLSTATIEDLLAQKQTLKGWKDYVLVDNLGKPMHRHGLYQRLERLGKKAQVTVTPHALRRAFVTINANKGRPLQMLQMACGHSDIKTTRSYCLTTETEVIEAMKEW